MVDVKFESEVEPRIYWVREDLGTLGYINIDDEVRVVLLRGLKKPKHIEVVDHRVYWLLLNSGRFYVVSR